MLLQELAMQMSDRLNEDVSVRCGVGGSIQCCWESDSQTVLDLTVMGGVGTYAVEAVLVEEQEYMGSIQGWEMVSHPRLSHVLTLEASVAQNLLQCWGRAE